MEDINIVLHDSIPGPQVELPGPGLSISPSKPENSAPADDRHLPHRRHHRVPPQNAQRAPVELAVHESEVESHKQPNIAQRGRPVDPLGPAHQLGSGLGPCREWVVDHCHHAEARRREIGGGGPDDLHRRWVGPGDDVVEVEAEVAELLFLEAERRRIQDPGVAITGFWFLGGDERER
ncbi:unnamed protein product [Linum tenue]|uniref:Uncharacterized protein n=1 Tax=Linum tenue TaxID=586396 RepID=A0AAV0J050_9ROSI|nr:unnamed protein product [Linum tenue]